MGNVAQRICPRRVREPLLDGQDSASSLGTVRVPTNHVQLAVSLIGPGAYHSSVVVNGDEYSFSDGGIAFAQDLLSHTQMTEQRQQQGQQQASTSQPTVIDFGMSHYTGSQLKAKLESYFLPGTYDLLRKNCNTFSDVAIFYLVHKRMDKRYRAMEKLGSSFSGLVQGFSGGQYTPNPKAADFDIEKVIQEIDPDKVWATTGHASGGTTVRSADAMREARLAALSRASPTCDSAV